MHYFAYRGKELYAEDVPVAELARAYGTPLYVYSKKTLIRHINAYREAFRGFPTVICYALKANSNGSILRLLAGEGSGADIVSGGELYRALRAGIPPDRIVYAGVGKTEEEIRFAIRSGILMFNVESAEELREIDRIAGLMRRKAPVALRVNPDIDPKSHPYISTGMKEHKFGIPVGEALLLYREAAGMRNVSVVGIHKHIGSQLTEAEPFVKALERIILLVERLQKNGIEFKYLDLGGGLGIPYREGDNPPAPKELAGRLSPLLRRMKKELTIAIEPGRSIVGNAGILVTKCLYTKRTGGKNFLIVDAGMNDLVRPSLYGSYHEILPLEKTRRGKEKADVVGPICESGDFLAKDRELPVVNQGEFLAVMSAGAYGFSMGSNYNSRPRPAEVLVDGAGHRLIRKRGTYRGLVRGEL
jgi:diaminopimelate decarboxylase